MTAQAILQRFQEVAYSLGYTEKITGDIAYRRPQNRRQSIKYLGTKNGYLEYVLRQLGKSIKQKVNL